MHRAFELPPAFRQPFGQEGKHGLRHFEPRRIHVGPHLTFLFENHATMRYQIQEMMRAEQIVRDLMRGAEPRRVRIDDILRTVSKHYGVNRGDLLSGRRNRSIVRPRQIGMYLAKLLTSRSLPEIGRRFGNRDHTTVLHAIRKIEQLMTDDDQLREEIELLKRLLRD